VIRSFADRGTEDIFNGIESRAARATCPKSLWRGAQRKLDQLNRVRELLDLGSPPGNRLGRLRGNRAGQHSIRINDQYRICFRWEKGHAEEVEIADYH
jgi:proteic killer suppression protein